MAKHYASHVATSLALRKKLRHIAACTQTNATIGQSGIIRLCVPGLSLIDSMVLPPWHTDRPLTGLEANTDA